MGIKKFIETLKEFGEEITSAVDGVFDEVNKTFDGLDTTKLTPEQEKEIEKKLGEKVEDASERAEEAAKTYLDKVNDGYILLERDKPKDEPDEDCEEK